MGRALKLQQGYAELKTELVDEVNMVDDRIVKPATDAKEYIQPLKKVIKQREDRKVRNQQSPVVLGASLTHVSWILKDIKVGSTVPEKRPNAPTETMQPWRKRSRTWFEGKRFVLDYLPRTWHHSGITSGTG